MNQACCKQEPWQVLRQPNLQAAIITCSEGLHIALHWIYEYAFVGSRWSGIDCSTLQPQGRKTSLKKDLEQREKRGPARWISRRPSPCLGARFPCLLPAQGVPNFLFLLVDTEGKWKLVGIGAQIVLLPCLLGTLVVTRRALTHSNCGI